MIASHLVLKWLHIIAMVYWLGGEWGVFQTSYHVTNPKLSLDERRRHMETAYRIDILARLGIILLLPIGLHMGHNFGVQPLGGGWLVGMWILTAAWVALALSGHGAGGGVHAWASEVGELLSPRPALGKSRRGWRWKAQ